MKPRHLEQAEAAWHDMDLREKIAAIDPDHDADLLAEYAYEARNIDPRGVAMREAEVHDFLDSRYRDAWITRRADEIDRAEVDDAYADAKDEGRT